MESSNTAGGAIRQAGKEAVAELSAGYLQRFLPFATMNEAALAYAASVAEQVFFPSGTEIIGPDSGAESMLYVLVQGEVGRRTEGGKGGPAEVRLAGECFPLDAAMANRPAEITHTAETDCWCYRFSSENIRCLVAMSPEFSLYCVDQLSRQLAETQQLLNTLTVRRGGEQRTLHSPLSTVGGRQPLAVTRDTPLGLALEQMSARRVGSVVIVDEVYRPLGVFTRSDLLERVVLPATSLTAPIGELMTGQPLVLGEDATAYDAVLAMVARSIRHVLVVDADGKLTGVVSERDLFTLQRAGPWHIRQAIDVAGDIEGLQRAASDVRRLARSMMAQGIASPQLTQFISALNDALTRRVLEINFQRHDLYGLDWCWLAFGSEGRDEQTFSTDQDNGIIFVCNDFSDRDELRLRFIEFARDVNRDLDRCGFPLCKGNIMAGNPSWCLTIEEWEEQFFSWVRTPEPAALLNATIFFDFRPLFGKMELADRLRRHLLALTTTTPLFLKAMASNALDVEPPLGTFRDFRTDLEPGMPGAIDLKKYGSRLFVDVARIQALATGVGSTNTCQRLRLAAARLHVRPDEVAAIIEAFDFIQMMRLKHQPFGVEDGTQHNLIIPDKLNELDRRILKEAFRQAKKLQLRLKLDYQTG